MKTYIIAGNSEQARNWLREKEYYTGFSYKPNDFQIVTDIQQLKGIENPSGVFVGTWYAREGIGSILDELLARSRVTNPGIVKAFQVYTNYLKYGVIE